MSPHADTLPAVDPQDPDLAHARTVAAARPGITPAELADVMLVPEQAARMWLDTIAAETEAGR